MSDTIMNEWDIPDYTDVMEDKLLQDEFMEMIKYARSIPTYDSIFFEEVDEYSEGTKLTKSGVSKTKKSSINPTKSVMTAYGGVTDVAGGLLNMGWNGSVTIIEWIGKFLKFISSAISKVFDFFRKMIGKMSAIPKSALATIKGDMQLYFPIDSIGELYSKFLPQIQKFTDLINKELCDNGTLKNYVTMCNHMQYGHVQKALDIVARIGSFGHAKRTNTATRNNLERIYNVYANARFTKTAIPMNDVNKDRYFASGIDKTSKDTFYGRRWGLRTKRKTLVDTDGGTYYDHMSASIDRLNIQHETLKKVQDELKNLKRTGGSTVKTHSTHSGETTNAIARIDDVANDMNDILKMVQKTLGIIAEATKCMQHDINTLYKIQQKAGA